MSQKHFIDNENTSQLIEDALESLKLQNGALHVDKKNKIAYNAAHEPEQYVTLIAGGGAGHEPAHAMYVGRGMLSAAVSGNLFASPSVKQIYQCASTVQGAAGTILIIKNYTGDVFHFHQAAEKLRASLGARVEVVVVADDVAVGRRQGGKVGRRGLAGAVLMHKILGAMAASSLPIDECLTVAREVNAGLATMGVSLDHVRLPGTGPRSADQAIGPDEVELGMGIHNETGARRLSPRPDSTALINLMLDYLLSQDDEDRGFVDFGCAENVVLMVNNLGALSVLELSAITLSVSQQLGFRGIKPSRTYSGTYMTSLNGPGFSITLLRASTDMLRYLDAPTSALGWSRSAEHNAVVPCSFTANATPMDLPGADAGLANTEIPGPRVDLELLRSAVISACRAAIAAAPSITDYDMIVGDGDCGTTLQRACEEVTKTIASTPAAGDDSAVGSLLRIAHAVEDSMDGTSGAIYGLFFHGLVSGVREVGGEEEEVTDLQWIYAARTALQTVQKVTPARAGDRTLVDALEPFVESLLSGSGLAAAVDAAARGADKTKGMQPKFGRAVYVNEKGWDAVPDPGAMGVVALVKGLAEGISSFVARQE